MLSEATSPACPAPYVAVGEITPEKRVEIADAFEDFANKLNKSRGAA